MQEVLAAIIKVLDLCWLSQKAVFLILFFVSMHTAKSANQSFNSQHEIIKGRIWFRLYFSKVERLTFLTTKKLNNCMSYILNILMQIYKFKKILWIENSVMLLYRLQLFFSF